MLEWTIFITPDLTNEKIVSADASYILRAPKFKARLTGFYSNSKMQQKFHSSAMVKGTGSDTGGDEDTL